MLIQFKLLKIFYKKIMIIFEIVFLKYIMLQYMRYNLQILNK